MSVHYDNPNSPLVHHVATAMRAPADPSCETITHGRSSATIRRFGGHIVTGRVVEPLTGQARELLYPGSGVTENQLRDPKIRASHFGAPVGPDGFGVHNKHGVPRYTTYDVVGNTRDSFVALEADLREAAGFVLCREVSIGSDRIDMTDYLELSTLRRPEETSMVNHLYLQRGSVQPSADHPLTINGNLLDDVLREDGAAERIIGGEARLWPGFANLDSARIAMPDGSRVEIAAAYNGDNVGGALLWAPPGENAFCFEPVVGVGPNPENNRGLTIAAGRAGSLAVTVVAR